MFTAKLVTDENGKHWETEESRKEEIFFGMQYIDNELFKLNSLIQTLYTAMDGKDEMENEVVQAYMAVMQEHTDGIAKSFNDMFANIRQLIEKAQ